MLRKTIAFTIGLFVTIVLSLTISSSIVYQLENYIPILIGTILIGFIIHNKGWYYGLLFAFVYQSFEFTVASWVLLKMMIAAPQVHIPPEIQLSLPEVPEPWEFDFHWWVYLQPILSGLLSGVFGGYIGEILRKIIINRTESTS